MNLNPHWLDIELTESVMMSQIDVGLSKIRALFGLGVGVVIDDLANYGTADHVIISIMAGIRSVKFNDMIEGAGGSRLRIVRVMPNTPLMCATPKL